MSKEERQVAGLKKQIHNKACSISTLEKAILSMKDDHGQPLFRSVQEALELRLYDLSESEVRAVVAANKKKAPEDFALGWSDDDDDDVDPFSVSMNYIPPKAK